MSFDVLTQHQRMTDIWTDRRTELLYRYCAHS